MNDANVSAEAAGRGDGLRPRARELGIYLGELSPGPSNAITDVAGVQVGHCTVIKGDGALVPGDGPARTGVTAVIPHGDNVFAQKVPAAVHVVNGFGKAVGFVQVEECGVLETPILLTNTLSVGRAADALVDYMLAHNPAIGVTTGTVNPVVGECNDGWLNDIRGRHVKREHVVAALRDARTGPVKEGAVGAGTGMTAFGWKGGIGTASRLVPGDETVDDAASDERRGSEAGRQRSYVLGALVLSNYGASRDLIVGGWPVGRFLPDPRTFGQSRASEEEDGDGSVVIVLATDAPLDARQLRRIAARAVVGIVRTGSRLSHGSGDYAIAFSTARRVPHTFGDGEAPTMSAESRRHGAPFLTDDGPVMARLLRAAGEATEEAVLNSMLQAKTTVGRDGHVRHALPVDELRRLLRRFEGDDAGAINRSNQPFGSSSPFPKS